MGGLKWSYAAAAKLWQALQSRRHPPAHTVPREDRSRLLNDHRCEQTKRKRAVEQVFCWHSSPALLAGEICWVSLSWSVPGLLAGDEQSPAFDSKSQNAMGFCLTAVRCGVCRA